MRFVGIDPSTKTGMVILDRDGRLLDSFEVTAKGTDPERMLTIVESTLENIEANDLVVIEGFGFASQSGFLLGGIGWGIRMELFARGIKYLEAAPTALKKYASGKGNTKKDELAVHIYKQWGFESKSDNVRDAFVLAHIARSIRMGTASTKYQQEVVQAILEPPVKQKKRA
ncbi:crossover junction endodeoxyribonuclease RuvC [Paenibacillus shirakamiensis]|uniref:Crossover junction endodeoxyribonuclease RuvC n=1 Tax=Paenibacillus shirakamiensis TaxID=1265935 RepID=A0ABS4JDD7_9BACL|nr:hypothetical protein [Paenibacillus shirakamiensis]MBP1999732.1 crossover junction endodeoxyribonuclease RuvC [Paenibacillus shirakamiensis]